MRLFPICFTITTLVLSFYLTPAMANNPPPKRIIYKMATPTTVKISCPKYSNHILRKQYFSIVDGHGLSWSASISEWPATLPTGYSVAINTTRSPQAASVATIGPASNLKNVLTCSGKINPNSELTYTMNLYIDLMKQIQNCTQTAGSHSVSCRYSIQNNSGKSCTVQGTEFLCPAELLPQKCNVTSARFSCS